MTEVPAFRKVVSVRGGTTILARPVDGGYVRRDVTEDWCIIEDYDVGLTGLQNLIKNLQGDSGVVVHEFGEDLLDEGQKQLPMGMPSRYY